MSIEIVTHCWAKPLKQYAILLRAQLSSLVKANPRLPFTVSVCFSMEDEATRAVLRDFDCKLPMFYVPLENERLWRRSIGRNVAGKATRENLVWFTDCDYLVGEGCLEALEETWIENDRPELMWPRYTSVNSDKSEIDQFLVDNESASGEILPKTDHWTPKYNPRAIGGIQIASGNYTRQYGYLANSKWQIPADRPFPDFRDDVIFRELALKNGRGVEIRANNLYRMRHTEVGYGK